MRMCCDIIPHDWRSLAADTAIAAPIFGQVQGLQQQNQQLTTLREWLLPLLMNAQVRVE